MPNISISIRKSPGGGLTNAEGRFRLTVDKDIRAITFSATGYHALTLSVTDEPVQILEVHLARSYTELKDVVVNGKRGKYRNKNNPAVELIRQVIANKSKNGPGAYPYSSFQQYEKTRVLTDKIWGGLTKNKLLRRFHFVADNLDTIAVPGRPLISIYLEEILSQNYYQKEPEKKKEVILGHKSVDYGQYIDMQGIAYGLKRLYPNVNIYDNNIPIFATQFLSPISNAGPAFYEYFIRDTIIEDGVKLVKLYFTPRNPEDLLFRGTMYITLDGNYAVRRIEMGASKRANLNWARDFSIKQDFEPGPEGRYYLSVSTMSAWYSLFPKTPALYGERTVWVTDLSDSVLPDSVFRGFALDSLPQASHQPEAFWSEGRPAPLSAFEEKTYANTDSLVHMKSYKHLMDWITVYNAGYKSAGPFDIGPVGRFYSFNDVEGNRFRFGGRSNTRLSHTLFTEEYVAYGTKDERWKFLTSWSYSFNHRSIYQYPFHFLQASWFHDTRNPGQEDLFSQGNTFLSSFNRGYNSKWLYNDIFRISYIHEFRSHFSFNFGLKYWDQQPAGTLYYVQESDQGKLDTVNHVVTTELSATFRWAPHEEFFQNKTARSMIINKYPILTFQYAIGVPGLIAGQYSYSAIHFNISKRFYVSPLGFTDVLFDAGYLTGTLPFPLLIIHPANQSYFYSGISYNLMNTEEFVSDHYAGVNIDHYFNGFFLNKIPLLRRLRLREVVEGKILFGGLRPENDPNYNPQQFLFPTTNGAVSTFSLNGQPYIEAGVGIDNIFSFIRVDLIKRFTYTNNPYISTLGLRFSSNFHF